jgi:hypothetical protein
VTKKIYSLILGTLAFGGAGALASSYVWPEVPIPLYSLVAAGLCLIPTVVTLIWASRIGNRQGEQQLLLVLGGTAVRMTLVLAVSLLLYYTFPTFERMSFWIVILVFYLFTLAFEIALLVSGSIDQKKERQI